MENVKKSKNVKQRKMGENIEILNLYQQKEEKITWFQNQLVI